MSGLDKIIGAIEDEAKQNADALLAEARKSVEAIEREAKEEEALFQQSFFEEVEFACKQIIERAASDDRQKRKGYLLKVRSDAISSVIEKARAKVEALPVEAYFDFLYRIFVRSALPAEGVIRFARRDAERMPADFIDRCNAALPKGSVRLGESTDEMKAGFLIAYGKIEQNCSIESVFESNRNMLSDKVNAYLMAGEQGEVAE